MGQATSDRGDRGQAQAQAGVAVTEHCHVCQRRQELRWHSTAARYLDRAECRKADGDGVWLCATCEEAAHRFMRESGADGAKAVDELIGRLYRAFTSSLRPYRRRKQ